MRAYIERIGLFAPGLQGWEHSREVLAGKTDYIASPLPK